MFPHPPPATWPRSVERSSLRDSEGRATAAAAARAQVREACAILDLPVMFYPCPKDSPNFREEVRYLLPPLIIISHV